MGVKVVSERGTHIQYPIFDKLFHGAYMSLTPPNGMSDTFTFVPLIFLSGAMKRGAPRDSAGSTHRKPVISSFLACWLQWFSTVSAPFLLQQETAIFWVAWASLPPDYHAVDSLP